MKIPATGIGREELFNMMESFKNNDLDWKSGKVFGYVYDPGREAMEVGKKAYMDFLTENGLDFTSFPSLLKIEKDLISIAAEHLNGGEDAVGTFTSGGTESIILAVKAARDYFREKKPEITEPEIILPTTAHAAFHKAAYYLGLKVVPTGVDHSYRADVDQVRAAITPNTILIVGSSPSYAHGVIDPIADMAAVAKENNILCHVDGCVGGFLLPYFKRAGADVPDFDFSVDGVTSISMDFHKYAYASKGASIVMYKNKNIRKNQIFACAKWAGYSVVNSAVQSAKSGGPMAGAWATLHHIGDDGYLEIAKLTLDATNRLVEGIEKIDGLRMMVKPDFCMFSFTSDEINIFHIVDEMNSRGWYIQPQFAFAESKENIHLSVTVPNVVWVDALLKDLEECVEIARNKPDGALAGEMLKAIEGLDMDSLTDEDIAGMMTMAGLGGNDGLPKNMAEINQILNVLPPSLKERLLVAFVNEAFTQNR